MNKGNSIVIGFFILAGVGLIIGWYWWSNPERQIRKTLTVMAEFGSSPTGESPIAKAVRSRKLSEYFSENAFIEWPGDEVILAGRWSSREQIGQQVLAAKNSATYKVSIDDLAIASKRRRREATVKFTLVVHEGINTTWAWLGNGQLLKNGRQWSVSQLIFAPILRR